VKTSKDEQNLRKNAELEINVYFDEENTIFIKKHRRPSQKPTLAISIGWVIKKGRQSWPSKKAH
jgi:hypothetical protein